MKRTVRLGLVFLILLSMSQITVRAQAVPVDTSIADTTIVDENASSYGHQDVKPEYPGGPEAYAKFVRDQLTTSPVIKKNRLNVTFRIAVVYEKDGTISSYSPNIKTAPDLVAEVIRILKLMPKSKPATRDGKLVRYRSYYPFAFKYNSN